MLQKARARKEEEEMTREEREEWEEFIEAVKLDVQEFIEPGDGYVFMACNKGGVGLLDAEACGTPELFLAVAAELTRLRSLEKTNES